MSTYGGTGEGQPRSADLGHPYYDHESVTGDLTSALRDALTPLGWSAIVAHTGGGCMAVGVSLPTGRYVLIGNDDPTAATLDDVLSGGCDVEDAGEYVGSYGWNGAAGQFVEACDRVLRQLTDDTLTLT